MNERMKIERQNGKRKTSKTGIKERKKERRKEGKKERERMKTQLQKHTQTKKQWEIMLHLFALK